VRQLLVKPAAAEWTLHLEGALVEDMDRGTFESGSAPNCHLGEWADADGNTWAGIPLYYLLGRVDDENKHESGAFNVELAEKGYEVDVVAADGYKVTFDSQTLSRNKTVILAFLINDQPLEDKYFPLRLVGSSLEKSEMVGAVAQIVLHLDEMDAGPEASATPESATPEPEATAPEMAAPEAAEGTLHIWGKVASPLAIAQAEFEQQEIVKITAEHPKKGKQDYQGVRLNDLLQQTEPAADATKVLFTAGDGYTAELPWTAVTACADCLVTFDGTAFALVMPGQESGVWVKDVRLIEVK
jgi:DMSO/TMAO reductase YedYZ molybdopterin-dependent catalytic subunit